MRDLAFTARTLYPKKPWRVHESPLLPRQENHKRSPVRHGCRKRGPGICRKTIWTNRFQQNEIRPSFCGRFQKTTPKRRPARAGLRDIVAKPQLKGLWTWTRGGGWWGPYIHGNEQWVDLHARVLATWWNSQLPHLGPSSPVLVLGSWGKTMRDAVRNRKR